MFQNAALDVGIGLALMYLVLSLVCTVVNEYIASKLKLRAKSLASGLTQLLDDGSVRAAFYGHGLVAGVTKAVKQAAPLMQSPAKTTPLTVKDHPSYIATDTFVLALVGSLVSPTASSPIPGLTDVQAAIGKLPDSNMKSSLQASLIAAQGDFDKFRLSVAAWFDNSMDRLSGAYKRNLKWIAVGVGCLVAVIINADSFAVGRALWSDAEMVQSASATVKAGPTATDTGPGSVQDVAKAFAKANDDLRPLPIGWPSPPPIAGEELLYWFYKVVGIFSTGLALSLGAPFWFDTLSKFMNIRGTGAKPERQT